MKLISLTKYVLSKAYKSNIIIYMHPESSSSQIDKIEKYANFLNLSLTKGMFVPCNEDGNVLEEPILSNYAYKFDDARRFKKDLEHYQQAKEQVFFEYNLVFLEFINEAIKSSSNLTIEWLVDEVNCTITESVKKRIGL
jgi:hypothetical protein